MAQRSGTPVSERVIDRPLMGFMGRAPSLYLRVYKRLNGSDRTDQAKGQRSKAGVHFRRGCCRLHRSAQRTSWLNTVETITSLSRAWKQQGTPCGASCSAILSCSPAPERATLPIRAMIGSKDELCVPRHPIYTQMQAAMTTATSHGYKNVSLLRIDGAGHDRMPVAILDILSSLQK